MDLFRKQLSQRCAFVWWHFFRKWSKQKATNANCMHFLGVNSFIIWILFSFYAYTIVIVHFFLSFHRRHLSSCLMSYRTRTFILCTSVQFKYSKKCNICLSFMLLISYLIRWIASHCLFLFIYTCVLAVRECDRSFACVLSFVYCLYDKRRFNKLWKLIWK